MCLDGIPPNNRGPVKNTDLFRARAAKSLDAGVTRERLDKHGQLRALAPQVPRAVREVLTRGGGPSVPAPKPASVFLSYASEQRPAVLRIEQHLRMHGHNTWMDVYRLTTLQHLDETIFSALRDSAYFVACLSSSCRDASRYVFRELTAALSRAPSEKYLYLLPVVLDGTEPAAEFAAFSPIDLARPKALDELALTLEIGAREVI
jgi:hypothetical protein